MIALNAAQQMRGGPQALVTSNGIGQALTVQRRAPKWRCPWFTTASWNAQNQQWTATAKAGFVNGRAPVSRALVSTLAPAGRDFGTNPLTGKPYFSSSVFKKDAAPAPTLESVDIPLYLAPAVPLISWRAIGTDGDDATPQFFLDRGVVNLSAENKTGRERLLRAVDLILHQPRAALTAQITDEAGTFSGRSLTHVVLTTRPPQADDVLKVYSGQYQLPDQIDPVNGIFEEQAYDELKISTVYLLSAPGTKAGSAPDESWQPFVKHELFWNLNWIPSRLFQSIDVADTPNAISGLGALGAGLLLPIANTIGAANNDLAQQALNELTAKSQAGTWWTPTGGGHKFLEEPIAPAASSGGGVGFGRTAQAAARAQVELANRTRQQGLDPSFPFTAIGFDPQRFSIESSPDRPKENHSRRKRRRAARGGGDRGGHRRQHQPRRAGSRDPCARQGLPAGAAALAALSRPRRPGAAIRLERPVSFAPRVRRQRGAGNGDRQQGQRGDRAHSLRARPGGSVHAQRLGAQPRRGRRDREPAAMGGGGASRQPSQTGFRRTTKPNRHTMKNTSHRSALVCEDAEDPDDLTELRATINSLTETVQAFKAKAANDPAFHQILPIRAKSAGPAAEQAVTNQPKEPMKPLEQGWGRIVAEDPKTIIKTFAGLVAKNGKLFVSETNRQQKGELAREAAAIFARDIDDNPAFDNMAMYQALEAADNVDVSVGTLSGTLVLQKALPLMQYEYPLLAAVTQDFSDEPGLLDQTSNTRVVLKPAVQRYNRQVDAAGRPKGWDVVSPAQSVDIPVTLDEYVGVPIVFGQQTLGATMRNLFDESVPMALYALGGYMVDKLTALLTPANFNAYSALTATGGGTTSGSVAIVVDTTASMYPGQAISGPRIPA